MSTVVTVHKSTLTAVLLWLFLGLLGAHRLYLGIRFWWYMPILFVVGIVWPWAMLGLAVWWLVDGVRLTAMVRNYNDGE